MKYCLDKYPMGSFRKQKSAGRFMNDTYYENIKLIAKNVTKDLSILGVCSSSTLEVGAGKSVFLQQTGEAYTEMVNDYHKLNLTFTGKNIVFNSKDLIERAFELPRFSCIILDEWEDANYWSELGKSLRQFFRKCRQLNLFILIIIPNFFQLPMSYAISRSLFFVDVQFRGEFDRGYFSFYNFDRKRQLYIHGKKTQDYKCVQPNFTGRFPNGYAIDDTEYRKMKYLDMLKYDQEEKTKVTLKDIEVKIFKQLRERLPEITVKRLSEGFDVTERTGYSWLSREKEENKPPVVPESVLMNRTMSNPYSEDDGEDEDDEVDEPKEDDN